MMRNDLPGRHALCFLHNNIVLQLTAQTLSSHHLAPITQTATFASIAEDRRQSLESSYGRGKDKSMTSIRKTEKQEVPSEAIDIDRALLMNHDRVPRARCALPLRSVAARLHRQTRPHQQAYAVSARVSNSRARGPTSAPQPSFYPISLSTSRGSGPSIH